MSARDELARDITTFRERWFGSLSGGSTKEDIQLAGMLFDAGYVKPRVITSREELDALPSGSVILDSMGEPNVLLDNGWVLPGGGGSYTSWSVAQALPATVLHEGGTK